MKRALIIVLTGLTVIAVLATVGARVVDEKFVTPVVHKIQSDHRAWWPRAAEDTKRVSSIAPMPPWHGADVAPFLAGEIPWEGESGGSLQLSQDRSRSAAARNGPRSTPPSQLATIGRFLTRNADECRLEALVHAWNGEPGYEVADVIDLASEAEKLSVWRLLSSVPIVCGEVYAVAGA